MTHPAPRWAPPAAGPGWGPPQYETRHHVWTWLPVLTAGLMAWLAPLQAYGKTHDRRHLKLAAVLGAAALLSLALGPAGPIVAIPLMVYGVVLTFRLRDLVFSRAPQRVVNPPVANDGSWAALGKRALTEMERATQGSVGVADPAVQAALAARRRREESRQLAARDPGLARDLRIGRPDLPRNYHDGGLVDLNHAPAVALVRELGLPPAQAQELVEARDQVGGFTNLAEIPSLTSLTDRQLDAVADRTLLL